MAGLCGPLIEIRSYESHPAPDNRAPASGSQAPDRLVDSDRRHRRGDDRRHGVQRPAGGRGLLAGGGRAVRLRPVRPEALAAVTRDMMRPTTAKPGPGTPSPTAR